MGKLRLEDLPEAYLEQLERGLDIQLAQGPGAFSEGALNGMRLGIPGLIVALQMRRNEAARAIGKQFVEGEF